MTSIPAPKSRPAKDLFRLTFGLAGSVVDSDSHLLLEDGIGLYAYGEKRVYRTPKKGSAIYAATDTGHVIGIEPAGDSWREIDEDIEKIVPSMWPTRSLRSRFNEWWYEGGMDAILPYAPGKYVNSLQLDPNGAARAKASKGWETLEPGGAPVKLHSSLLRGAFLREELEPTK